MEDMPITISKFRGDYDVKTACLRVDVVEGTLLGSKISGKKLKITFSFDAEQTWLVGEMIDALRLTTQGFGVAPKLVNSTNKS